MFEGQACKSEAKHGTLLKPWTPTPHWTLNAEQSDGCAGLPAPQESYEAQFTCTAPLRVGHKNPGAVVCNLELTPCPLVTTHMRMTDHRRRENQAMPHALMLPVGNRWERSDELMAWVLLQLGLLPSILLLVSSSSHDFIS